MNQLTQRLLLFFIAIPLLVSIILFLPQYNHLVWNILLVLSSTIGASELFRMVNKYSSFSMRKIPFAGAYLPIAAYLEMTGIMSSGFTGLIIIVLLSIIMMREVFIKDQINIQKIINRLMGSILILLYPGIFMIYAIKISILPDASLFIILFLLLIFTNDSMAFVFGSLFGRSSTKLFLVSPNKSIVGFISGIIFTIATGITFRIFFQLPISLLQMSLLSFSIAITANAGDLIESAIKRSANVKDSGSIMPGRGGMLDSLDSILFCAPAYYFILSIILK
ncbi:MAG: phosphatidate cytidylyltransferase [Spirochaetales bacterium]|nr:phosphatidate cytidylyltransferase [Spirochaetales bacterium]